MKLLRSFLLAIPVLFTHYMFAQGSAGTMEVIVNEIYNSNTQALEWTELLLVKDNVSLAGFHLGDNNDETNSWQATIEFTNNVLWQRLRAGTYIVINHAPNVSTCTLPEDLDRSDGFIQVCASNGSFFTGGSSGTLNIAGGGDFIHLVDANGQHIHGIGFDEQPGTSVTTGTCRDNNLGWTITTGTTGAARPCNFFTFLTTSLPANQSLGNIGGNFPADYNRLVVNPPSIVIDVLTSPTLGQGNSFQNQQLIASWREPQIDSQSVCARTTPLGTGFSWRMATDMVPADNTTGYLILKSVGSQLFPNPVDGRMYNLGDTLRAGGVKAVVAGLKSNSLDTTFFDPANTGLGLPVYYRVYAFRYTNTPGVTSFDRGRAYNTSRFVRIAPGNLIPPTVTRITDPCSAGQVTLQALPNIPGAIYEWRPRSLISFPVPGVNGFEYSFPAPNTLDSVFVNYRSSAIGCVSGITKFIITPPPVFTANTLTSPSLICVGDTFEISLNGANTSSYFWEIPAAFTTIDPIIANTTRLRLVAQNSNVDSSFFAVREQIGACVGNRIKATFTLRDKPTITITGDTLLQYGTGTTLEITTDGLASWLNANGTLIANSNTLLLNALGETTTYIAKSEYVNSTGCLTTKSHTIVILARPDILVPNVITPDLKDGKNDVFIVKGATFKNLIIFNRWGKKVFEADTYQNDWAGESAGTYFYEALLDDGFKSEKQTGIIQVLK